VSKGIHIPELDPSLAQHFTPEDVARFVWDMVRRRAGKELGESPRIIDPAAGSGVFVDVVVRSGRVRRENAYGIEIDARLGVRHPPFYIGDGLLGTFSGVEDGSFDVVLGNPPFGKLSAFLEVMGEPLLELVQERFALGRQGSGASCPIELLFIERALQLVRPEGWIAFIMPEGFFANKRLQKARDWLASQLQVLSVVGLPEAVFRSKGTNARTGLVVLRKKVARGRVSLFCPESPCTRAQIGTYLRAVRKGRAGGLVALRLSQRQLLGRRWDAGYWQSSAKVRRLGERFVLRPLGDFIEHLTYGPIITGRKPEHVEGGVPIIRQGDIVETGLDHASLLKVEARGDYDPERSRVRRGDLLLPRSGAGALGRNRMAVYTGRGQANVGCFVDLVRLRGLNPFYTWFFFKTQMGWGQIAGLINGVGTPNINFAEIRSLRVAMIDEEAQCAIEQHYRRDILPWHRRRHTSESAHQRSAQRFRRLVGELELFLRGERDWPLACPVAKS